MTKLGRRQSNEKQPDKAGENGNASFAWEFEAEDQAAEARRAGDESPSKPRKAATRTAREPQTAAPSGTGKQAAGSPQPAMDAAQLHFVGRQLDRAMERWWALGELPPLTLLRDALLALEAGAALTESQRTLLLRAALANGRGVQTAMRYQVDTERVALVLAEAAVEWESPLVASQIEQVIDADQTLRAALVAELERSRVLLTGEPRQRAQAMLDELARPLAPDAAAPDARKMASQIVPPGRRKPLRQVMLLLLLITLVGFVLWQRRQERPDGMVAMPAASYALRGAEGSGAAGVQLAAFWIDRFEVSNYAYRACLQAGACAWPVSAHSATRLDYFTNPAFDEYPVVNVTYSMAEAYCGWLGKRLPTAEEWQAAASVSPVNGQAFRYPWGETFEAQRANSAASGLGDTVAVGTYRPSGDSPAGVADMAGNVAEWSAGLGGRALVKGGSFVDAAEALTVESGVPTALDVAAPQTGFRCAHSATLTPS